MTKIIDLSDQFILTLTLKLYEIYFLPHLLYIIFLIVNQIIYSNKSNKSIDEIVGSNVS